MMMYDDVCLYLPSEMPLDRVELSACPRVGLWLSITLSSSRCREPALGKVALLNSTVFILLMKLRTQMETTEKKGENLLGFFFSIFLQAHTLT